MEVTATPTSLEETSFMTQPVPNGARSACFDPPVESAAGPLRGQPTVESAAGPLRGQPTCSDDDATLTACSTPTRGLSVGLREGEPTVESAAGPYGGRPTVESAAGPYGGRTFHEQGLRFCREADSVVEGFLCDERVVVSDACRQPTSAFDAYVCDEPRMRALQGQRDRRDVDDREGAAARVVPPLAAHLSPRYPLPVPLGARCIRRERP